MKFHESKSCTQLILLRIIFSHVPAANKHSYFSVMFTGVEKKKKCLSEDIYIRSSLLHDFNAI